MSDLSMFSLEGKTAIVTGAERGIGLEIAVAFAKAGADIVIAGLMESEFEHAANCVKEQGKKCTCIKTDVSKEAIYYASDASTFTTGTVLQVDGGYTCL